MNIDMVKAVLLMEVEESQTIFGSPDDMLEALIHAIDSQQNVPSSDFQQLRAIATKNGFILEKKSQLNSAALRRFLEFGDPAMAILAAIVMQDCGVHTRLEVGETQFEPAGISDRKDRIYAFSERKLLVRAIGDEDFGLVARWHQEAYWQEWHGGFDIDKHPSSGVIARLTMRNDGPGFAWSTDVGYESYVHWPRIEKRETLKKVLKTLDVYDPPLELPKKPPNIQPCQSTSSS
jgi:hypothetical protein